MVGALTLYLVYFVLVLGLWLYWRRCRYWAHKFKDINTVPSVAFPVIGHMHEVLATKGNNYMAKIMSLGERCGALDTLKPTYMKPTYMWAGEIPISGIFSPEDIEVLLGSTKELIKPDPVYKAIKPFFGDGLISLNGATWQHHRKVLTPTFHFKILERYVDVFRKHAEVFVQELRAPKYRGVEVDAMPCTSRLVSQTICETAFGMDQRLSQREEVKKTRAFFDALDESFKAVRERLIRPWLQMDALYHLSPTYSKQIRAENVIREYSRRIIKMKREEIALDEEEEACEEDDVGAKKRVAFLDLVLRDGKNVFTEEEILNEVRTLVTVQQTTASTLAFIFVMLAIHQDVQDKVYEEICDLDQHSMSTSYYDKLGEMKYLERVIKETMRLYPVTIIFARELMEDLVMPSCTMPAGVLCFVVPFITHRDKDVYGPEPERFDPDHFLPERCRVRHPYSYIPFSAGSRNCIGQKYAMLQMKAVVSTVIRKIRIFPGKGCHSQEELVLDTDTFLHIVGGFNVRFEHREVKQSA